MLRAVSFVCMLAGGLMPLNAPALDMSVSQDGAGQLWLQITGRIENGDDARFKALLIEAFARGQHIENVATYSDGGHVLPAMKIGGYIRTLHLTTVAPDLVPMVGRHLCKMHEQAGETVVSYDPLTKRGDPRCACSGECLLIWAAGFVRVGNAGQVRRLVAPERDGAVTGAPDTAMPAGRQAIEAYLRAMGVLEVTIRRMFDLDADRLEYLTRDERAALAESSLQRLNELIGTRCRHHAATSPAALACEKEVVRASYWRGAKQLLSETE